MRDFWLGDGVGGCSLADLGLRGSVILLRVVVVAVDPQGSQGQNRTHLDETVLFGHSEFSFCNYNFFIKSSMAYLALYIE